MRAFETSPDKLDRPGAFAFLKRNGAPVGIVFACPCGCPSRGVAYFSGQALDGPTHTVSGSWPNATLSGELGIKEPARHKDEMPTEWHWRGHLRDGVFVQG